MEETQDECAMAEEPNPGSKPRSKRKLAIVLGVVATVVAAAGAGLWIWHEQPSFCGTVCHDTMQPYVDTLADESYLAHAHAQSGTECLDCHVPTIEEQVAEAVKQINGNYVVPFAKMEVDDEFCLRDGCHSREEIESPDVGVVVDGSLVNPHVQTVDRQNSEFPHEGDGEKLQCSQCHTVHRESKGMDYCYSCHHAETFDDCYSCHDHK